MYSFELNPEILPTRIARRGVYAEDEKWFSMKEVSRLKIAQQEIKWLLDRGYNINPIIELVGGHYQFSSRQRNALKRSTSSREKCEHRNSKLLPFSAANAGEIYIDGFNLIITIEVALSQGILVLGNDGTVRDVAGLRGSYSIIDKTDTALNLIGITLEELKVPRVKFFLDSPVSNSGRLKARILQHASGWKPITQVELLPNVDSTLSKLDRVVTSDSIILDDCISWFNISRRIMEDHIEDARIIHLNID